MIFFDNGERPLTQQVSDAEKSLLLQRQQLRQRAGDLDSAVRERITAPDALLWSAATGFALGEITKKRGPVEGAPARPHETDDNDEERPSTLQMIVRYVAIARPILATASTWLGPLLQRHAEAQAAEEEAMNAAYADVPVVPPTSTEDVSLARTAGPAA